MFKGFKEFIARGNVVESGEVKLLTEIRDRLPAER